MKNKIEDLRNHMFLQLEKLADAETEEEVKKELEKSKAIADLGKVLVDSAKVEVDFLKATGGEIETSRFFNQKQLS